MDRMQQRLRKSQTKFEAWKKKMKREGYDVIGENAWRKVKDKTSPQGFRRVRVANYRGKNVDTSANRKVKERVGEKKPISVPDKNKVQPRTWQKPYGQQSDKPSEGDKSTWSKSDKNQWIPAKVDAYGQVTPARKRVPTDNVDAIKKYTTKKKEDIDSYTGKPEVTSENTADNAAKTRLNIGRNQQKTDVNPASNLKIKKGPAGKIGKIMSNKSLDSAAKLKGLNKLKKSSAMFQRGGMAHKLRLAQLRLGR